MINRCITGSGIVWYSDSEDAEFLVFDLGEDGFADISYQFHREYGISMPFVLVNQAVAKLPRGHVYFTIELFGDLRKLPLQYAELPVEMKDYALRAQEVTESSKLLNILEKL